jgi:hypothetical protein
VLKNDINLPFTFPHRGALTQTAATGFPAPLLHKVHRESALNRKSV